jgi:hypothetical protein
VITITPVRVADPLADGERIDGTAEGATAWRQSICFQRADGPGS